MPACVSVCAVDSGVVALLRLRLNVCDVRRCKGILCIMALRWNSSDASSIAVLLEILTGY